MAYRRLGRLFLVLGGVLVIASARPANAGARSDEQTLKRIIQEVEELKADKEQDEKKIQNLEQKVDEIQGQNQQLKKANQKLQTDTSTKIETLQTKVESTTPASLVQGFFGEHQFVAAGGGAITYLYDKRNATNTFGAEFEPLFLYRLNDWLLFQGVIDAAFPSGSGASFDVPVAAAHIFLNDYMELYAGIFDLPFGDFNEDTSVFWANRFVTNPLPYGAGTIIPGGDLGVQLRGGLQWGELGQDVDYTAYVSNGPLYDTALPGPAVGQNFNGPNNISTSANTKAFGGRVRVYPLPLDLDWGRLELGASSYDGKWQSGMWLTSWGVDFNYRKDSFEARGEYLASHRQMPKVPMAPSADNRQGWFVQGGYYLTKLQASFLPSDVVEKLQKLELLVRYAGLNQRAVVPDEFPTTPGSLGEDASPSLFVPHPREVALGLNYWIAPSVVWKLEFDMELPRAGGQSVRFAPNNMPIYSAVGATPNDRAILTQLAIGF